MVAMEGVELVQAPPEVAFVREALCPMHSRVTPEFAPIGAVTVQLQLVHSLKHLYNSQ